MSLRGVGHNNIIINENKDYFEQEWQKEFGNNLGTEVMTVNEYDSYMRKALELEKRTRR